VAYVGCYAPNSPGRPILREESNVVRIALTVIVGLALAALASFGVYEAAEPTATQVTTPLVDYGSR
jgi:hypothetical protein